LINKKKLGSNSPDNKNVKEHQGEDAELEFKKVALESGWSKKAVIEISKWYDKKK